jgi:hypothetical protein
VVEEVWVSGEVWAEANAQDNRRAATTVQVLFIDKTRNDPLLAQSCRRKVKLRWYFESMILTCAEMAGEQKLARGNSYNSTQNTAGSMARTKYRDDKQGEWRPLESEQE